MRRRIEGGRIYLRDVTSDDATDRYCAWLNDPEVNRYLETRFEPQTRDRILAYIEAQNSARDTAFLAIVRKADDQHVGNLRIGAVDTVHRTATLALVIGEKTAWGAGIGTEAIELATRYAFEHMDLRKLTARCYAANSRSIRAFEKAGWTREGTQRGQFDSDGARVDGVWLGRARTVDAETPEAPGLDAVDGAGPTSPADAKQRVIDYYNQEASSYIDQYRLPRLEQEFYPANEIRLEIVVRVLNGRGVRNVLDIGCGSGGPLLRFLREGWDAVGFDFSPEMVRAARENLTAAGLDPDRVRVGDVEKSTTLPPGSFDGVVATGVFPHNLDDRAAYANLRNALSDDGIALVEYRNGLMGLFSLNRYSEPLFWHDLMNADALPVELREAAREFLARKFDTPVASVGRPRAIEYADILARFHNPLTIGSELAAHGLRLRAVHYYHFHAAPPVFERSHTAQFRDASQRLERPDDWRGLFLASAFVAEMERAV